MKRRNQKLTKTSTGYIKLSHNQITFQKQFLKSEKILDFSDQLFGLDPIRIPYKSFS